MNMRRNIIYRPYWSSL